MNFFTDLRTRVDAIERLLIGVSSAEELAPAEAPGSLAASAPAPALSSADALSSPDALSASGALSAAIDELNDDALVDLIELAAQTVKKYEQLLLLATGTMSKRSTREAGHAGLAQSRGFRNPAAFVQHLTGSSRSTALQQIRVGQALTETRSGTSVAAGDSAGAFSPTGDLQIDSQLSDSGGDAANAEFTGNAGWADDSSGAGDASAAGSASGAGSPRLTQAPHRATTWHAPLGVALSNGTISTAQFDAIKRGLGEPPLDTARGADGDRTTSEALATAEAWSLAAERLVEQAPEVTVEELGKQARAIRDLLDPEGMQQRFNERYERRSFSMWTDSDGLTHGKFIFDDESAEWVRSIIDSALRPRRGGPRFVSAHEQEQAAALKKDPRSNEQLAHDLLTDLLKSGAVADAETVFGARQAGVKLVQVVNRDEYLAAQAAERAIARTGTRNIEEFARCGPQALTSARFSESATVVPVSVAEKHRCNSGQQTVTVDEQGNPLNVGREQRLFTAKQRLALAIRDGGCIWPECDRPASYCEAHHIDHWYEDQGSTDIDRGVLLCRFHHLQLHNNGWKITRDGLGPFMLHQASPPVTHNETRARSSTNGVGPAPPEHSVAPEPSAAPEHSMPPTSSAPASPPVELRPPLPVRYAWRLAAPPKKRFAPDQRRAA